MGTGIVGIIWPKPKPYIFVPEYLRRFEKVTSRKGTEIVYDKNRRV
jgi:hypothetical protein